MRGSKPIRGHSSACVSDNLEFCPSAEPDGARTEQSLQNLGFAVNSAAAAASRPAFRPRKREFGPGIALSEMPEGLTKKKAPGRSLMIESRNRGANRHQEKPSVREGATDETGTRSKEKVMPVQAAARAYAELPARKSSRVLTIKPRRPLAVRASHVHEAEATSAAQMPAAASAPAEKSNDLRDRVVLENLPLVKAIAIRVHESLPVHVELDDLVHAGILGLFDAATKYNPYKQVAFSSYAKHRIKGAMLDSLRQLDWASRDMRRRHKQVEQVTRDLCAELQRNPTEDEVAQKMGVEVSRWRQMALDLRNVGLISASTRPNDNEDLPAPDFPGSPDCQPDFMCAKEQMREKLELAMSVLPERYRKVVTLYYSNELTMKEIGGMLGINESRVSQIHKSALEKMATVLVSNGITSAGAF
jgi:RNA polymerase sigma factor for flagellar operon FliA